MQRYFDEEEAKAREKEEKENQNQAPVPTITLDDILYCFFQGFRTRKSEKEKDEEGKEEWKEKRSLYLREIR